MKNYLLIFLSLFLFSSCLDSEENDHKPIIDPEMFGYLITWEEAEYKTSESMGWNSIDNRQELYFYTDHIDKENGLPNNGRIRYNSAININLKDNSAFLRDSDFFEFYYEAATQYTDTINLAYELLNDSIMIISDTTVTPAIQVKYKKVEN